ncbi:cytochrome P450 [Streptomyces sp. Tu 2975]|uniref:cytochrome P450 n=1 Tax=Streptomyces sp. Tu 2975 TaxID=2676871 RepID=UPI00135A134F|nr:cytochrome P450 [Streptomyces sp. Tu 2975]QIP88153.1 cytochrome P450 [Streptomyces sp. Tu 2975]
MELREILRPDATLPALLEGYAWLPDLVRRNGGAPVRTRLLGRPAIALHGLDAVPFFYDERNIARRSALPGPVLDTLFGRGAVHTLDGPAHRARKALFVSLLKDATGVDTLAGQAVKEWDAAAAEWAHRPRIELFTETSVLITRAVCDWAGVPRGEDDGRATARDLVAMVDGFATTGPRHWRARKARTRQEERLRALIEEIRRGGPEDSGSALHAVALHRDDDDELLDPRTAAVEVLNIIRPTAAVAWFMAFAAHALHRWPRQRELLREGGPAYAEAFAHEVRRFYPFAPFLGGVAVRDLEWRGERIAEGTLVLLDVYGHHHDPALWPHPYVFEPARFADGAPVGADLLIPQGGGDTAMGHRCPGEDITVALLKALVPQLARLEHGVPPQDLSIPLRRIPTRPVDGFLLAPPPPVVG